MLKLPLLEVALVLGDELATMKRVPDAGFCRKASYKIRR